MEDSESYWSDSRGGMAIPPRWNWVDEESGLHSVSWDTAGKDRSYMHDDGCGLRPPLCLAVCMAFLHIRSQDRAKSALVWSDQALRVRTHQATPLRELKPHATALCRSKCLGYRWMLTGN